jgi:hypothetical protein
VLLLEAANTDSAGIVLASAILLIVPIIIYVGSRSKTRRHKRDFDQVLEALRERRRLIEERRPRGGRK